MPVTVGSRLGPYEVLAPLGAGGMGEVYRAKDPRLKRDVAIKVLPASFSQDTDRLRRFEQEAQAAGALNHPNITAVYDIGRHDGAPYVVQELLEGESLRSALAGGKLSPRRAIDYAIQIAQGLAAAHDKEIVHRDLKPENLFVTKDDRVKILDFGLAKLAHAAYGKAAQSRLSTETPATEPGVVLGTLGYMSPEQVRGQPADARSDIFALGAVLYEMLSGARAFRGGSAADTMSAILNEDPPDLSVTNKNISPALERIVRHCLEKSAERRFQSARDLGFDLEALSGWSTPSGKAQPVSKPARARLPRLLAAGAAIAAAVALAYVLGARSARASPPTYRQLTFRRGTIMTARFSPDGGTIVYGAAWDGGPFQVFTTRPGSPESSPLPIEAADLLAVSPSGELALSRNRRFFFSWMNSGTLARVPLAGGAPRDVLEFVQEADWAPDGSSLLAVRRGGGRYHLEFPIGQTLYETAGWISHPRISPDGSRVAFVDHPIYGDDRGTVAVVDRKGGRRTLTPEWSSAEGLAWSPDGGEIWFTSAERGSNSSLRAVTSGGRIRTVANAVGRLTLLDVSRQGLALVSRDQSRVGAVGRGPEDTAERELSWLDCSAISDISADGRWLLFTESGEGGGRTYGAYLRRMDGSPAARLGDGTATALSPDGKWALAIVFGSPDELKMLPTGAGRAMTIPRGPIARYHWATFLPDGRGLLMTGNEAGKGLRIYRHDLASGAVRPVTPEGVGYLLPSTPDGRFVASSDTEGRVRLYPLEGSGEAKPIEALSPGDVPLRWSRDGRYLFVRRRSNLPISIERLDCANRRFEPWQEIAPADRSGLLGIPAVRISEDGRAYAYSYQRLLSELYLVEGLK